jgi:hypothetical protein
VTLACFEASGDLQTASEERDEDADEGEARTSELLATASRVSRARREGQTAFEDSRCGSRDRIPWPRHEPPLQYNKRCSTVIATNGSSCTIGLTNTTKRTRIVTGIMRGLRLCEIDFASLESLESHNINSPKYHYC